MANFEQERTQAKDDELLTFLFTTREGGRGIVQIFPKDRGADRFRLRYRMWSTAQAKPAARPSDEKVAPERGGAKRTGTSFGDTLTATIAQPAEDQGFVTDLNTGQQLMFIGPGMIQARLLPETFNELTVRDARDILERAHDVQPNIAWIKVDARLTERPDTFAFKTPQGVMGLLQIEPSEQGEGNLTIRYRIERPD